MIRSFSLAFVLLFAGLFTLGVVSNDCSAAANEQAKAKPKAGPVVTVEDNMGFVGTAWLFTLNADGTWEYRRFFPRNTKGNKSGKLTKDEAKAFTAKLEKAGAFDAKAKDIEPRNPQLADGAYFAVMRGDNNNNKGKNKGGRLQFKHGGPTSKAVGAVIEALTGGGEAKDEAKE